MEQALDRKDELDDEIEKIKKEKEPLEAEFEAIKNELDKKNDNIATLKVGIEADKNERVEEKERQDKEYE